MINKVLISACLLGQAVRYDGQAKHYPHPLLDKLIQQNRFISFCPECAGGLNTPRPAAEIQSNGKVVNKLGQDISLEFEKGAQLALDLCQQHKIKIAILKANSPSCGNEFIYNGEFTGKKIQGMGITAKYLTLHGIKVFNENQLDQLGLELT